jgi:hypothetical protein
MFLTHLLFTSPRLRFSEAQKVAVLNWAKELRAIGVPSLYALRKCQKGIEELVGHPTKKATSPSGDVFYLNDVGKEIAKVCSYYGKVVFI